MNDDQTLTEAYNDGYVEGYIAALNELKATIEKATSIYKNMRANSHTQGIITAYNNITQVIDIKIEGKTK